MMVISNVSRELQIYFTIAGLLFGFFLGGVGVLFWGFFGLVFFVRVGSWREMTIISKQEG